MGDRSSRGSRSLTTKHYTLLLLTVQNSALILIMHYSRIMPPVEGRQYFTSTAVFLNEAFKLALSLSMSLHDLSKTMPASASAAALFSELFAQVFTGDSWKVAIPAMLYTLQNSLQYIAVSNLDIATFQVTYQAKILTTALFSVLLLGRRLDGRRWFSLVLLMIGVAIVQIPSTSNPVLTLQDLKKDMDTEGLPRTLEQLRDLGNAAAGQLIGKRSATYAGIEEDASSHQPQLNTSVGLTAVLVACLLSGVAGVYFEKVLKDAGAPVSIWVRNLQLSIYSLPPALFIGVMFKDGADISKYGFFAGYNWVVWTAIAFQASGGVIVSLSILHADNIAKNFATSISILISLVASVFFFDFRITLTFVAGTAIVLLATYLYTTGTSRPGPLSLSGLDTEKSASKRADDAGYFDIEKHTMRKLDSPRTPGLRASTSSRPQTPTYERRHGSSKTL